MQIPQWHQFQWLLTGFDQRPFIFFDCLTDLHDSQITIYHWHDLADRLGEKAIAFRQMLISAGLENPFLTVCILDEEPDEI